MPSNAISEAVSNRNMVYLDTPIRGGTVSAKEGSLIVKLGGDPSACEKVKDMLRAISNSIYHNRPFPVACIQYKQSANSERQALQLTGNDETVE
ncbi:NAD(P)-binding domain-containing protein [Paenibacillus hemerocallicola]|uniref:NAD(P)-binding domain-containing protein n=1 Tax=Paenibacillus hemerocallicola TaxID=1172614 RepID=UPI003CCC60BF